jgi:hypothetical protein
VSKDPQHFWTKRWHTYGHTGWADPVIYAYDQLERLALIQTAISQKPIKDGLALDFGCGTGDFSKLLLKMGFTVCGYDPFVKPDIRSSKFVYASTYEQIPFTKAADLVLVVTTLTHILREVDLRDALTVIRQRTKPGADVYALEYALDCTTDRDKYGLESGYQLFRTVSDWKQILSMNELRLLSIAPFPQPLISPSTGFLDYNGTPLVRFGRRCSRLRVLRLLYTALLRWHAAKFVRPSAIIATSEGTSPLKLIHCSVN